MRVCVAGLWHLGAVTSACMAEGGHLVVGFDEDVAVINQASRSEPPLFEPGLAALFAENIAAGRLSFTADARQAVAGIDVLWITYDTPVDDDDNADVEYVIDRVGKLLPLLPPKTLVLVSSQLPVGSMRRIISFARGAGRADLRFACSPENLRLGKAIEVFTKPDRVIVGVELGADEATIRALFGPCDAPLVIMGIESAEMTKHAINSFLAMSVAFANEIASVCETVGANAAEVAQGLKTERRIGPMAYVSPGVAFSGGTLARDIGYLSRASDEHQLHLALIPSVKISNEQHRAWPRTRLRTLLGNLRGRRVALLGLTYKPGTDTLRRSYALELAQMLREDGATLVAFDPAVSAWPAWYEPAVPLALDAAAAVQGADAAVITTEWPQFRNLAWDELIGSMAQPVIIDPKGHLHGLIPPNAATYAVVGSTSVAGGRAADV